MVNVKDKMALIQSIFIESKKKTLSIYNLEELNNSLLNTDSEFISIAYEAASMGIAINSIEKTNSLELWKNFYQKYGKKHSAQVHVGLGWALSELNLEVSLYLNQLEPLLKYRIIDGIAYYDGKFKRTQTVRLQQIPKNLDDLSIKAYNQGLGRSLWYIAQGDVNKLVRLVEIFPKERHYDMWRGIGVAVAYVGGIASEAIQELILIAGANFIAFKCGVAIATHTREIANAPSDDTNMICNVVLNSSHSSICEKLIQLEKETNSAPENIYFDWINKVETQL